MMQGLMQDWPLTPRSARLLDGGLELMRQCLDNTRAWTAVGSRRSTPGFPIHCRRPREASAGRLRVVADQGFAPSSGQEAMLQGVEALTDEDAKVDAGETFDTPHNADGD